MGVSGHSLDTVYDYLSSKEIKPNYPDSYTKNQKNTLRKYANKFVVEGINLYYYKTPQTTRILAVRSQKDRDKLFYECHTAPAGGHLGRDKTVQKIGDRFYWPGQYLEIADKVSLI
jgi:hypothetical protein